MPNPFATQALQCLLDGAPADALRIARMGLSLSGDEPALLEIAADSALQLNDDACAADCLQRLLTLDPADAQACNSLGIVLERLQRPDEAEAAYHQALALLPDDASLHSNLGLLLENRGRLGEAEQHQRRAVHLAPDCGEIHANLAGLLGRLGHPAEAEALYREAIRLQPDAPVAHSNLGVLLTDQHRDAAAEAAFRTALALAPDYAAARTNLGQLLLAQGRFAEGWLLHEGRLAARADPGLPRWQGEPLAGKSIVVLPEQGLGDEIQFCRYLPWLKARGAARVTLVCRPGQTTLLHSLAGPDTVLSQADAAPLLASHDYWTVLLSLPRHAGTTLDNIPASLPYLHPDPARLTRFAPLLAGEGLRVGLVWHGNPEHANDADRSLPGLETLAALWAIPGLRFFSLQKGSAPLPPGQPLTDLAPLIADFADSAALLAQLDLLISVDSAPAHLAGALGVPCWLLLPAHKTDWRWLRGRDDSPWYPGMRLFRQPSRGDWRTPLARLAAALDALRATTGRR